MARNLFAILDDLTASLASRKAALTPLALIRGDGRIRSRKALRLAEASSTGRACPQRRSHQRQASRSDARPRPLHGRDPGPLGRQTRAGQEGAGRKGSRRRHRARAEASPLGSLPRITRNGGAAPLRPRRLPVDPEAVRLRAAGSRALSHGRCAQRRLDERTARPAVVVRPHSAVRENPRNVTKGTRIRRRSRRADQRGAVAADPLSGDLRPDDERDGSRNRVLVVIRSLSKRPAAL